MLSHWSHCINVKVEFLAMDLLAWGANKAASKGFQTLADSENWLTPHHLQCKEKLSKERPTLFVIINTALRAKERKLNRGFKIDDNTATLKWKSKNRKNILPKESDNIVQLGGSGKTKADVDWKHTSFHKHSTHLIPFITCFFHWRMTQKKVCGSVRWIKGKQDGLIFCLNATQQSSAWWLGFSTTFLQLFVKTSMSRLVETKRRKEFV